MHRASRRRLFSSTPLLSCACNHEGSGGGRTPPWRAECVSACNQVRPADRHTMSSSPLKGGTGSACCPYARLSLPTAGRRNRHGVCAPVRWSPTSASASLCSLPVPSGDCPVGCSSCSSVRPYWRAGYVRASIHRVAGSRRDRFSFVLDSGFGVSAGSPSSQRRKSSFRIIVLRPRFRAVSCPALIA